MTAITTLLVTTKLQKEFAMHIFSDKKSHPTTVSIFLFLLALLFSSGCANNEKNTAKPSKVNLVELTPAEQAEIDPYVKEHGRDAIMCYFEDKWRALEKNWKRWQTLNRMRK